MEEHSYSAFSIISRNTQSMNINIMKNACWFQYLQQSLSLKLETIYENCFEYCHILEHCFKQNSSKWYRSWTSWESINMSTTIICDNPTKWIDYFQSSTSKICSHFYYVKCSLQPVFQWNVCWKSISVKCTKRQWISCISAKWEVLLRETFFYSLTL